MAPRVKLSLAPSGLSVRQMLDVGRTVLAENGCRSNFWACLDALGDCRGYPRRWKGREVRRGGRLRGVAPQESYEVMIGLVTNAAFELAELGFCELAVEVPLYPRGPALHEGVG